jgi:hypothetical protein
MEQDTSPVKVVTRIEIEVGLGGTRAISTGDVVVEALLEAGGEATGVEGHGLHLVLKGCGEVAGNMVAERVALLGGGGDPVKVGVGGDVLLDETVRTGHEANTEDVVGGLICP